METEYFRLGDGSIVASIDGQAHVPVDALEVIRQLASELEALRAQVESLAAIAAGYADEADDIADKLEYVTEAHYTEWKRAEDVADKLGAANAELHELRIKCGWAGQWVPVEDDFSYQEIEFHRRLEMSGGRFLLLRIADKARGAIVLPDDVRLCRRVKS